jgi:hypothetical protein
MARPPTKSRRRPGAFVGMTLEKCYSAGKDPVIARRALALRDLQDVHQRLRADAFQAVEPCRSAHTF